VASLFIAIGPAQAAGLAPAPAPIQSRPVAAAAQPAATVVHPGEQYVIADKTLCSAGFAVTNAAGRAGFVSAGHCGASGDAVQTPGGAAMGTFVASSFPGTDYGWVAINPQFAAAATVTRHNGTVAAVHGDAAAPVGSPVCMSGQASGWHCGTITAVNQSVQYEQGIVSGLTATTVCTDTGDSGGAFVSGDQAQGVVSGGVGDCSSNGATYFQPVVPILAAYGLTLRTG
jgi:streptogrisin C